MSNTGAPQAVSFDLFGTLVTVESPSEPATVIAAELRARDIPVPADWEDAYTEMHLDIPPGREIALPDHVEAALASRGVGDKNGTANRWTERIEKAVTAAFDREVSTRDNAVSAVGAVASEYPAGVLSNCSVPSLVEQTLRRSRLDPSQFDTIVTSVDCGWRKPHQRAFETVATELDVDLARLVHVGDDPRTDAGAEDAGATAVLVEQTPLDNLPDRLEGCR